MNSYIEKSLDKKYAGIRASLENQLHNNLSHGLPLIFSDQNAETPDIFIDKIIEFARGREELVLENNPLETLETISSKCYIKATKDGHSFAVVKSHDIKDPSKINIYAFSTMQWREKYYLIQLGRLGAQISDVYDNSQRLKVADISWVDTIETKVQEFEDSLNIFAQDSGERKIANSNIIKFSSRKAIEIDSKNKGIGRALLDAFDDHAKTTGVNYAILESLVKIDYLVDDNGNLVYENGEPKTADINTDIFYSRQGFLKIKQQPKPTEHKYMCKTYRPVHTPQLQKNYGTLLKNVPKIVYTAKPNVSNIIYSTRDEAKIIHSAEPKTDKKTANTNQAEKLPPEELIKEMFEKFKYNLNDSNDDDHPCLPSFRRKLRRKR